MTTINVGGRSEPVVDRIVNPASRITGLCDLLGLNHRGSFAIAALSLILLALGSGFGLTSASPWPNSGVSVTTFTPMTAIWLVIVQWLAVFRSGRIFDRPASHQMGRRPHS